MKIRKISDLKLIQNFLVFPLIAGFFSHSALSQSSKCQIKGQVSSYKTKEPIEAKLVFEKQPDASLTIISQSSQRGYRATLFERGEFYCLVSAEGYVTERWEFNLTVDSLKTAEVLGKNFELIPISLNEVLPFNKILFDITSYKLSLESMPELARLANMMAENPSIKISLEGYTDNNVKSKKTIELATNRIKEVKKWLIIKGIPKKRIKLKAIGENKPLVGTDTKDLRRVNRRVEVRVISL